MLIFIDIETSGLQPGHFKDKNHFLYYGELLEVAAIRDDGKEFVWRMKPMKPDLHHPKALEVNGYDKRASSYIKEDWNHHIKDIHKILSCPGVLYVGHNVQFDIHWLNYWFEKAELPLIKVRGLDTMTLAHEHLTPCGLQGLSFDKIRNFFGWEKRPYHDALNDCRDTKRLFYTLTRATVLDRFIWGFKGFWGLQF